MTLARVTLYETSATARTVAERAVHPAASALDGHVDEVRVELEQTVAEGDVLVRLDARASELALAEGRARRAASASELAEVEAQIAASDAALAHARAASAGAVLELAAARRELELIETLAREELSRLERLEGLGGVSQSEIARARTETARAVAALETESRAAERAELERERALRDRESDLAALRRERARLAGELALGSLELERLAAEIERRAIRAPAAGKVAELAALSRGTWVGAGTTLATIVAGAGLAVQAEFPVAELPPAVAAGLRGLCAELGLVYGAADLIRRPGGEHVFLEINPGGEWGMLERDLDLPISAALAGALLTPHSNVA